MRRRRWRAKEEGADLINRVGKVGWLEPKGLHFVGWCWSWFGSFRCLTISLANKDPSTSVFALVLLYAKWNSCLVVLLPVSPGR